MNFFIVFDGIYMVHSTVAKVPNMARSVVGKVPYMVRSEVGKVPYCPLYGW